MTYAELQLWNVYFGLVNDEHEEAMKKARNNRR